MKKCIGRITLNFDELNTLLTEVETVVNSRPRTYVEDDQDGVTFTLCPSHLINGRRITNTPNAGHFEVTSTNASLTRKSKHHRHLLQQSTCQWRKFYLLNLRENHAHNLRKISRINRTEIAVGDVVIVKSDSTNRMYWNLATVEQLLPGKDGMVRAAMFKVSKRERNPILLKRSIKHLFPIEVNSIDDQEDATEESDVVSACPKPSACPKTRDSTTPEQRPRRNAAILADIRRRNTYQS